MRSFMPQQRSNFPFFIPFSSPNAKQMGSNVIFRISYCFSLFIVYQYYTELCIYFSYFILYAEIVILRPEDVNPEDFGLDSIRKAVPIYLGKY